MSANSLPDFERPPLVEVALGIQFEPMPKLGAPQIGLLWHEFREQFPETEDHAALEPELERFDPEPAGAQVLFRRGLPALRAWFLNENRDQLLQVQRDRIIRNWRRGESAGAYPRYRQLQERFVQDVKLCAACFEREGLGPIVPKQCEVTYVNRILCEDGWDGPARMDQLLTVARRQFSDSFLADMEDSSVAMRFVICGPQGAKLGRLYIRADPAYFNGCPGVHLQLTARGAPEGDGIEGAFRFLDRGHEWVVRGFTSVTTERMHKVWGRRDDTQRDSSG